MLSVKGEKYLESWQEIAEYLGKSIGTVRRWDRVLCLPVYRIEGARNVYALRSELQSWVESKRRVGSE